MVAYAGSPLAPDPKAVADWRQTDLEALSVQACWQEWVGLQLAVLALLELLVLQGQFHSVGFHALAELGAVHTVEELLKIAVIGCFVVLGQDAAERSVKNASCLAAPDGE